MCWPRSFCYRCPEPFSFPWPPVLLFGRSPRRPAHAFSSWSPWSFAPPHSSPLPNPVIPRSPWDKSRHVHFADDHPPLIDHAPAPRAPMSPFVPPMTPSPPVWPHENLCPELCSPRGSYPYLDWDITQFPSSAKRCTSAHSRAPASLDGSATFPPIHLLTLSFADNPVLAHWEHHWGPIFARAQGLHALTVEDVLDAIYTYFNQPLSGAEYDLVSPHAWGMISDSYRQRLPRSPNMRAYDVRRGALRLDVLNGATKFSGLQCVGRDHFRLILTA